MLNTENVISEEIVAYNLTAPKSKDKIEICLIPQNLALVKLVGRFVSDGTFESVNSDLVIAALSLDENIVLDEIQAYDLTAQPTVKEIRVSVKSEINQINQGSDCNVFVKTSNRKGETVTSTISGDFDEKSKTWLYPVNEKLTFDKSLYYELLGSISVDVSVVYA